MIYLYDDLLVLMNVMLFLINCLGHCFLKYYRKQIAGSFVHHQVNFNSYESAILHYISLTTSSVPNYCQSVSPKQTTFEEDR